MSLIHQAGNTCAVGELDLHALSVTQKDILKTLNKTKTTNNALTNTTTSFDFTFQPSNNYTDLSETTLYLEFTIEKPDGTALLVAVEAAPVNNLLHSIFANVQLLINGEKVTGNYEQYPYKAYLTDLIATEYRKKVTRMEGCQKWIPYTAGQMDIRAAANARWMKRRADSVGPEHKCVIGRPHLDILNQCKLVPSHCKCVSCSNAPPTCSTCLRRDEVMEVHNKSVLDPRMGPFNYPISGSKVSKTHPGQALRHQGDRGSVRRSEVRGKNRLQHRQHDTSLRKVV